MAWGHFPNREVSMLAWQLKWALKCDPLDSEVHIPCCWIFTWAWRHSTNLEVTMLAWELNIFMVADWIITARVRNHLAFTMAWFHSRNKNIAMLAWELKWALHGDRL
eukprot:8602011-Pyramimonas_sp.AAC.1